MRQTRIERKSKAPREARNPILSLDPRDPDVVRAKAQTVRVTHARV
ncbi:MAG TPA: hypothetical protein VKA30_02575 [Actinomycetota bacterium]|nr:hypothetical protein [Actinomycetota bacterium]